MRTKLEKLDAIKARGATVSNLGVLRHPATKPSQGELRRAHAMKSMYARSRPSTAPADVSRMRKLDNTFSTIVQHGPQVPRKGEHTPVYDTRNLIVHTLSSKLSPLDYLCSSQAVCGRNVSSLAAKLYAKERMARSRSKEKLWARKRSAKEAYDARVKCKRTWTDSNDARMRTVIRSKLLYYENLKHRFSRDKAKREKAGY